MAEAKKLSNGKWRIRIRIKNPLTNEWVEKSSTQNSKSACKKWEVGILAKYLNGDNLSNISLVNFFDLWEDTYIVEKDSQTKKAKYRMTRKNVEEFFSKKQLLKNIDKIKYQKFLNWLETDKKYADATVRDIHKMFRTVIIEAIDLGHITRDFTRKAKLTGLDVASKKTKALSKKELTKLKKVILESPFSVSKFFVLTQLSTGCRYQEIAGLRWENIHYKDRFISIEEAYNYNSRSLKETKTPESVREIDVKQDIIDLLLIYKKAQEEMIENFDIINYDGYIFCGENGEPITNTAVNKYLDKKCKIAKVPTITSHAFRHTKTDLMILDNFDTIYIATQLGHADITTTLKYYNQFTDDIRYKNKKKIDKSKIV